MAICMVFIHSPAISDIFESDKRATIYMRVISKWIFRQFEVVKRTSWACMPISRNSQAYMGHTRKLAAPGMQRGRTRKSVRLTPQNGITDREPPRHIPPFLRKSLSQTSKSLRLYKSINNTLGLHLKIRVIL